MVSLHLTRPDLRHPVKQKSDSQCHKHSQLKQQSQQFFHDTSHASIRLTPNASLLGRACLGHRSQKHILGGALQYRNISPFIGKAAAATTFAGYSDCQATAGNGYIQIG